MIVLRFVLLLMIVGAMLFGFQGLSSTQGTVVMTWGGTEYTVSILAALGIAVVVSGVILLALNGIQWMLSLPERMLKAWNARRYRKGFAALQRGLFALNAGDAREAKRLAQVADQFLKKDKALVTLLRAEASQAAGDHREAIDLFNAMLSSKDMHLVGLRGLHDEAKRAGETEAALGYAQRAYDQAPLPWAVQSVLQDCVVRKNWAKALQAVETHARTGVIEPAQARRWRAVLKTALAQERAVRDPRGALALALEALSGAPDLVPATVIYAKLIVATGFFRFRKASRVLEQAYRMRPHPDFAEAYLHLRLGASATERLARAKTLAQLVPDNPESLVIVARAYKEVRDLDLARKTLRPLLKSPSVRVCLLMAEIEEAAGAEGSVREWLNRAVNAPRDATWVAGTLVAERWLPASPDGVLDAFEWRVPEQEHRIPLPSAEVRPASFTPFMTRAPDDPGGGGFRE